MFTNRDKKKYKEENVGIENILPTHSIKRHRYFNALTKKVFGTSVYTKEELVSFFRSLIRINYYKCITNSYENNEGIRNTEQYCREDLHNFKLLGNKIKIKVTCIDNKSKEVKLKYFFKKYFDNCYYLNKNIINNNEADKCMINDLLLFLKAYDIDLDKLLPHIMFQYTNLKNDHSILHDSESELKYVDTLVNQDINRSEKTILTRRHSYKRPEQKRIGNCWEWASVRMIIKFIQNIVKFNPVNFKALLIFYD
jgi:hypothetical protein